MSNKIFTTVPVPKFPRSTFSLSRPVLFTPRMHKEYPSEILEVIPGDGFKIWTEAYAKSMPMVAPVFAKSDVAQESFFVPAWQLSDRFDDFITGGERGMNTDKMPYMSIDTLYSWIDDQFDANLNVYFGDGDNVNMSDRAKYNERLTVIQDILESCDILRSIPFVVPDFVPLVMSGTLTPTAARNISNANENAFESLNSHLSGSGLRINLLPFAACLKVWCEFYRDENLCDDLFAMYWCGEYDEFGQDFRKKIGNVSNDVVGMLDTDIHDIDEVYAAAHALFGLKSRAWKKDYYTSALPFVQKGPDVMLPVDASVQFRMLQNVSGTASYVNVTASKQISSSPVVDLGFVMDGSSRPIEGHIKDVGTSIQDVRTAFRLEEMYEADGRFGSRYPENTLGQFGVRTPDSRLPRCEFLGSSKQPIQIQQVVQNSQTDDTPQGNLAGLSTTYGSNRLAKTYQSQHGFLICMTAIRVHSLYQQGIHPMFSRYDRTEYAWPRFAHLGEQPIYEKQLYVDDEITEDEVFGYTPRYADYKSDTGSIHGKLKSSLNVWTMARRFGNKPELNKEFIYSRPRQDAFVVENWLQPCFVMELDYHVRANRVLPFYGQPTL